MRERAIVVAIDGEHMWVEAVAKNCPRCAEGKGCGGGVFLRLASASQRRLRLPNQYGAKAQEAIWLIVDDAGVVKASCALYGLPLLLMLSAGLVGEALIWPEPVSAGLALLSLGFSFALAHKWQHRLLQLLALRTELVSKADAPCVLAR